MLEAEVERPLALNRKRLAAGDDDDGNIWRVIADPEGNEFCVAYP